MHVSNHTSFSSSLIVNYSQYTTYNISCASQQNVSTQMSPHQANFKTIFKVYKVTAHIWDPKGLRRECFNSIVQGMVQLSYPEQYC
jgi:hypothetical protein